MTTSFHFHASCVTRSVVGSRVGALAVNHAAYVERVEAVEIGSALAGRALVFSNISDDPERRRAFWEAVDRCERQGHAGLSIKTADIRE